MPNTVAERARLWSRELREPEDDPLPDYVDIHGHITYLADRLYNQYVPTQRPPHLPFPFRLRDWLDSARDQEDQKVLFQAVPYIYFIGTQEFDSLYLAAFQGPIARWLIDELNIELDDHNAATKLNAALRETWFCSITDSLDIGHFYRLNNITGRDIRPELRSYLKMGDAIGRDLRAQNIADYMQRQGPPLRRLVLLEDFVGSGKQSRDVLEFAANLPNHCNVLFCPLVICPQGSRISRRLESDYPRLQYSPVLELTQQVFLPRTSRPLDPPLFEQLRNVVLRLHPQVLGSDPDRSLGPFGFRGEGAFVVLHSNCPNNSLPIIHHSSNGSWCALFPRNSRL